MKKLLKIIIELIVVLCLLGFIFWFILTQPVWVSGEQVDTPEVSTETLHNDVVTLSEILPSRFGNEKSLEPTVKWIEKKLQQYGTPYRQTYQVENELFHNIILRFGPDTHNVVVVGAHYDTDHGLPGADDNASGVAGLIELARLLSNTKLTSRVELVAYTLEEQPFFRSTNMGSYIHAKSMKDAGKNVTLMMSLEMIGYFSDKAGSQKYPVPLLDKIYPNKGNFIGVVANMSNIMAVRKVKKSFRQSTRLPVYSINAPALIPGIDFSDHRNYWIMDYPAVMITDTAFARNMAYHTVNDTADRLDYEKMAQVIQAVYFTVLEQIKN